MIKGRHAHRPHQPRISASRRRLAERELSELPWERRMAGPTMNGEPTEGGCLCGAVRYRVSGEPVAATLCHCRSCRKASGGTNVAWAGVDKSAFEGLSDEPGAYSSSPGSDWWRRHPCGSLGGYRRCTR